MKAPGALLLALEGRAPWEFGAALAAFPLLRCMPHGDGHPVVVFPGLATPDLATLPLRLFLSASGYNAHGWDLHFNFGPRAGVLERSIEHVRKVRRDTGRKVSLVGWSLGGLFAREIAKVAPEDVRCVITMGSPFTGHPRANNVWRLYEFASGHRVDSHEQLATLRDAPPVPTTSVFSRTDGIVAWPCCVQGKGALTESIEVTASHIGMGMNPVTWYAVADRLAQREGRWKPFHRQGWRKHLFNDPYRACDPG